MAIAEPAASCLDAAPIRVSENLVERLGRRVSPGR